MHTSVRKGVTRRGRTASGVARPLGGVIHRVSDSRSVTDITNDADGHHPDPRVDIPSHSTTDAWHLYVR